MILSEQLILFLYSEEFLPAAAVLRILIWDLPFVIYAGFCGRITTIISEEKASARIYTIKRYRKLVLEFDFDSFIRHDRRCNCYCGNRYNQ